jgi:hypothetical protein
MKNPIKLIIVVICVLVYILGVGTIDINYKEGDYDAMIFYSISLIFIAFTAVFIFFTLITRRVKIAFTIALGLTLLGHSLPFFKYYFDYYNPVYQIYQAVHKNKVKKFFRLLEKYPFEETELIDVARHALREDKAYFLHPLKEAELDLTKPDVTDELFLSAVYSENPDNITFLL